MKNVAPSRADANTENVAEPNRSEIDRHVGLLHDAALSACAGGAQDGMFQLSALHPTKLDDDGKPLFRVLDRFKLGAKVAMADAAEKVSRLGWNVYVEPRLVRQGLPDGVRGTAPGDTVGVFAHVVDVDAYKGETPETIGEPSLVVLSSEPNSLHRWYFHERLLSEKEGRDLGARMRQSGGDSNTGNISQPYRLAGTPNFPSEKKINLYGRRVSPTRLLAVTGKSYRRDAFSALWPKPAEQAGHQEFVYSSEDLNDILGRLPISIRTEIERTDVADRSKHFHRVTGLLKEARFTISEARVLWEDLVGVGEKYVDRQSWPNELEASWRKLKDPIDPALWAEPPHEETTPIAKVRGGILDDEEEAPAAKQLPAWLEQMNKRHCLVTVGSKTVFTDDDGKSHVRLLAYQALSMRYANRQKPDGKTPLFDAWLSHPDRHECLGGVDFDPNGSTPDVYNLWKGFPPLKGQAIVDASGEGCALLLRHIREVICSGDEAAADYLIRWLAHLVQRPGEKPGVAVILKGEKGAGKDTLGQYLGRLLGPLYMHATLPKQLIGDFNAHMGGRLLVHAEELAWKDHKGAAGALQALITAPVMAIEAKGVDAIIMKSFVRVIATSNAEWVVPATFDERRYFVLNVSSAHRGDRPWFNAIQAELSGNGPAALRRYLEAVDLTGFEIRDVPSTAALAEQKLETLEGFDRFWYELLYDDHDDTISGDQGGSWEDEPATVPKKHFRKMYDDWCDRQRLRPISGNQFAVKLEEATGMTREQFSARPRGADSRLRAYPFPPLRELRKLWNARF